MGLRRTFNLAILATFLAGFSATALLLNSQFDDSAREQALEDARVMMRAANAIRSYTGAEITPIVGYELDGRFLRASVPAFAARSHFAALQADFPEYTYKEAALNPTNLADRTMDWEADIVMRFRQPRAPQEIVSERDTPTGRWLNLARPISVPDDTCLKCHGQPAQAPASMTALYGSANGFGWNTHEVIGAQIVSLPLAVPLAKAHQTMLFFLALLTAVFLLMMVTLNLLLRYLVVRPVMTISAVATQVSLGHSAEELRSAGHDEISALSSAFNRMRRSLEHAMAMLEEHEGSKGAKP